jgi:hypothetical protein
MPRFAAVAVALVPALAAAQHVDAVRVAARPTRLAHDAVSDTTPASRTPPPGAAPVRVLTAILGWGGGFAAGAWVGYQTRQETGGDFDGLPEALVGGAVGGILGAAAGAAVPAMQSPCDGGRRFGRGIAGAVLGAAAGLVGLAGGWTVAITVPVGTVIGATVGAHNCRPTTTA